MLNETLISQFKTQFRGELISPGDAEYENADQSMERAAANCCGLEACLGAFGHPSPE
jgi:hypothetical protein